MKEIFEIVFGLLGGLAMFIYGMNMMSDGLQKAAGERMKKIIGILTRNPVLGVLAVPLYDAEIKERVLDMFNIMMNDNVKARHQLESGVYIKPKAEDAEPLNSQEYFYEEAYRKAGHSHATPPFA